MQGLSCYRLPVWVQVSLTLSLVHADKLTLVWGFSEHQGMSWDVPQCCGRRQQCCFVSGTLSLMPLRSNGFWMLSVIQNFISVTCPSAGITFCSTSISSLTAAGDGATETWCPNLTQLKLGKTNHTLKKQDIGTHTTKTRIEPRPPLLTFLYNNSWGPHWSTWITSS